MAIFLQRAAIYSGLLFMAASSVPGVQAQDRPMPQPPTDARLREQAWQRHQALATTSPLRGLQWRSVGPVRQGGRVVDVAVVPGEPYTFYVAYASGGVWKTTNNGGSFEPLLDQQPSIIVGAIALDPSDPAVIWVGTGEENSSRSSYGGMGMLRSADGGATWERKGLVEGDRVAAIVIDPRDGDRVLVAVLGKLYTPGGARGVYRTRDGGDTWEQVLAGEGPWTGFIDLEQDPSDPDVLYAAAWERSRRPWNFVEGGAGSGIYKSLDGGSSWTRLAGGLPQGEHVGRIGLAIARSHPQTVYASIDNQEELPADQWDLGGDPLSVNRLRTMSREQFLEQDPAQVERFVRGNDLDTEIDGKKLTQMIDDGTLSMDELREELADANANLFNTNIRGLELWRSDDGGGHWRRTHEQPIRDVVYTYGYYFGGIAVAPDDPERVYLAGVPLIVSTDGGATWASAQGPEVHGDYHPLWIDPENPERMIVGNDGGVDVSYDRGQTWFGLDGQPVGQFYAITLDNAKPYNIYGGLQDNGSLKGSSRTRWKLGQTWNRIGGGDGMYVQVDPRNDDTLYTGFQFGFYQRAGKGGRATVRPRDKIKQPALRYNWTTPILLSPHSAEILYFGTNILFRSMDRGETWSAISPDLTRSEERGDVPFATVTTIAESPESFGLLWVGTDDGLVQVSEDGGVHWREATAGLPRDRWVSRVEASAHARNTAYVALNGYRDDDQSAYLYRTDDLGKSFKSIAAGLPAEPINVVREDPVEKDVLYVGTDRGVYVSLDGGGSWQTLGSGLPNVPVHDLAVHRRDRELVAGTHGRSVWVVDVLPVQELENVRAEPVHLFPVEAVRADRSWRARRSPWFDREAFHPEVKIPFWAAEEGDVTFDVLDGDERVLHSVTLQANAGINSLAWDLLVDQGRALAAEAARSAEKASDGEGDNDGDRGKHRKKGRKGKPRHRGEHAGDDSGAQSGEEDAADANRGRRADIPYAEAVRLGWPLYITPGSYSLRLTTASGEVSETDFKVKASEPPRPRMKKEEPIRGTGDDDESDHGSDHRRGRGGP